MEERDALRAELDKLKGAEPDEVANLIEAAEGLMSWQVKNVKVWNNSAYDLLSMRLKQYRKAAPQAPAPLTEYEKAELATSWFGDDWDIKKAVSLIGDVETTLRKKAHEITEPAPQAPEPAPLTDEACDRSYLNGLRAGYGYGLMEDHKAYLKSASNYKLAIEKAHEITGEAQG
jgi:hypothetical protein